jgi:hypothetical protein
VEAGTSRSEVVRIVLEFAAVGQGEDAAPRRDSDGEIIARARRDLIELEAELGLSLEQATQGFVHEVTVIELREGSILLELILELGNTVEAVALFGGFVQGIGYVVKICQQIAAVFLNRFSSEPIVFVAATTWPVASPPVPVAPAKEASPFLWYLIASNLILILAMLTFLFTHAK